MKKAISSMTKIVALLCLTIVSVTTLHAQFTHPTFGEYFDGYTKEIAYDRMIPPYGLEVTFLKTTHVIFPYSITYVDLGSNDIIAGKATGAENVLRIKASTRSFSGETNISVITGDGSFYSFNIRYSDNPTKLNVEMKDFLHDGEAINRPNNALTVYLSELKNESPRLVYMVNQSIYRDNKRHIKHIGAKRFGIQYLLKGIYVNGDLFYLHTEIKNNSNVPFDVDYVRIKVVDKKTAKRTAIQEAVIYPIRAYNYVTRINGKRTERTVFAIEKITIPDDKKLVIELFEKNGGRSQSFDVENADLTNAVKIDHLKVK